MEQITIQDFIDGYEQGYIQDVIVVKGIIYGKDPRGMTGQDKPFKIVYANIP